jgi:hypothetical protein
MQYRPHHLAPAAETAHVMIICHGVESHASHIGLRISADYTCKCLGLHKILARAYCAKDAAEVRQLVNLAVENAIQRSEVRPSHVVIAAPWIVAKELARLAATHPEINFYEVSHSNVGFLQADPHAIKIMRDVCDLQMSAHNVYAGGNSEKFARWATDAWRVPVAWVPNLYPMSEVYTYKDRFYEPGTPLRIGIFGANRSLKNHTTAAAAAAELAIRYGARVEILMSSGRDEGATDASIREMLAGIPNVTLIKTGWLEWPQFRALVRSVNIVFQVSFTESFNVVTADSIAEGVPVVVGSAIHWVPPHWIANPDDALDVARVADTLLRDRTSPVEGRQALTTYVERAWSVGWKKILGIT